MESVQLPEISTINVNILLIYHLYKRSKWCHFTEIHRKTSNFDMCLLSFISTCYFCFMKKIIYYFKRNWLRFNLPKFCCSSIYVITIVKFNNRPIQNLFNFLSKLLLISVKWCKPHLKLLSFTFRMPESNASVLGYLKEERMIFIHF